MKNNITNKAKHKTIIIYIIKLLAKKKSEKKIKKMKT